MQEGNERINSCQGHKFSSDHNCKKCDLLDPEGILARFKSINPAGIAIDLEQPGYLGDEDSLLRIDLQEAIPELARG